MSSGTRHLANKIVVGFVQWDNSQFESPFTAAISDATYSCDSQLVYVGFADGSVGIFDAKSLRPRSRLASPIHAPIPRGVSGYVIYTTIISFNANYFLYLVSLSSSGTM